jgi:serine/threonine-protein kinase
MVDAASGDPDFSGKTLGDFRLLRRLCQGGMGQVYLGEQISLKRKVAVKIMRTDVAASITSSQRFRAEAEAVAQITHANIVQVYAFGAEAGLHYMALEYVEGRNLRQYLSKKGPPDLPLALSIMRQVAAALQRAGELGIVHRDIKPENILLTRRGEVKVADFGLSRCFAGGQPALNLTQPGVTMGTPLYMSPEQVQGQPVDPRSDIYSFGVTCYHMLAGDPPFRGQTALELALQHVKDDPLPLERVRPDVPIQLCAIIHKMMAKDMEKRYQTCAELRKDLDHLRGSPAGLKQTSGTSIEPVPASTSRPAVSSTKRPWSLGIAAISILFALLAGGTAAWLRNNSRAASAPQAPADELAMPQLTEQEKQQKFLQEAVEQYANPGSDKEKLEIGLRHAVELGLFYLRHDRLDAASDFFEGLRKNPYKVETYEILGRLGEAIILARQDRAAESNKLFLELRNRLVGPTGQPAERRSFQLRSLQLYYEIGRALERNKANETSAQRFPPQLDELRLPPRSFAPPAGPKGPGVQNKKAG